MLYERAKHLQRKGLSAAEIRQTLLSEGAREEDITVILGSLGFGPQTQAPTPRLLELARRLIDDPRLRYAALGLAMALVGGLLYGVSIVEGLVSSLAEQLFPSR